jgi:hypothetical protein
MIVVAEVEKFNCNDLDMHSLKESKWKNIGINAISNVVMDNTIMVATIRIIGMSFFSNPL